MGTAKAKSQPSTLSQQAVPEHPACKYAPNCSMGLLLGRDSFPFSTRSSIIKKKRSKEMPTKITPGNTSRFANKNSWAPLPHGQVGQGRGAWQLCFLHLLYLSSPTVTSRAKGPFSFHLLPSADSSAYKWVLGHREQGPLAQQTGQDTVMSGPVKRLTEQMYATVLS